MKWLQRILNWWYYEIPVIHHGQDANEFKTGLPQLTCKYEINVSKQGKHVFATDSHIRNYHPDEIGKLVKLFRASFPDCKVSVSARSIGAGILPKELEELNNMNV